MYNDKHTQSDVYLKLEDVWNLKWEEVKTFVLPCLVPVKYGLEVCKNKYLVHSNFLDLSVYYYIRLESDKINKRKTAWVNHTALKNWGITTHRLKMQAVKNLNKDGYIMQPIQKMIPLPKEEDSIPLYVLINRSGVFGAASILNTDRIAAFAEEIGQNIFIIPSSIHELLLLPDDGQTTVEDLDQMIKEINDTLVEPQDRLSNHAYYYNRITDEIQMEKQGDE